MEWKSLATRLEVTMERNWLYSWDWCWLILTSDHEMHLTALSGHFRNVLFPSQADIETGSKSGWRLCKENWV